MSQTCTHLDQVVEVEPSSDGCEDCLRIGGSASNLATNGLSAPLLLLRASNYPPTDSPRTP